MVKIGGSLFLIAMLQFTGESRQTIFKQTDLGEVCHVAGFPSKNSLTFVCDSEHGSSNFKTGYNTTLNGRRILLRS